MTDGAVPGVPVFDLVGVGFGPSNLAMAVALAEYNEQAPPGLRVTSQFLERQTTFGWHPGMLIQDATMQVSFLKDLVTLRNPASRFSFLCYLQARGRLMDFVNHKTLFPLRIEFHDYLEWAAAQVDDVVAYGREVVAVEPMPGGEYFDVRDNTGNVIRARNLVLGTGLRPRMPDGVRRGDRIWHNSELLSRIDEIEDPQRFVVVGAGQSGAEVAAFLHERFPRAEVCPVFARYGYSPSDDSAFANRIFDPEAVDQFYDSPPAVKQQLLGYHANTNYSVVDIDLINELYRREYQEKVRGTRRLRMFNVSRTTEVVRTGQGVRATVVSLTTGEQTVLDADVAVFATGYLPADPLAQLGELARYCLRDEEGALRVGRDYRVWTAPEVSGGIYLQGGTEHTHGITSSLLSITSVRVGEILQSIVDQRPLVQAPRPAYAVNG
ncbi:L-ornithine N5-oxygenase [Kibdelosporangium banguiense]|uniref:L-lysine N6-monooxygenase MbtG n=1 Tax=Kibdelosporangium banguiense TaxID=1365924 RepID=A0ABS4TTI8_9PSEU|nr:SidA/IucD/PvdA family monooxygenase [Kibdelosporangium banguiense]MBP2327688.1 L-ornithine N5-oxygenase [Kibdelosporangium banguiense]